MHQCEDKFICWTTINFLVVTLLYMEDEAAERLN